MAKLRGPRRQQDSWVLLAASIGCRQCSTQAVKALLEPQAHLCAVRELNVGSIAAALDGGLVGWRRLLAHIVCQGLLK